MKFDKKEIFTISNFVSLLRVLLFVPIYFALQKITVGYEYRIYAVLLFILAFLTDVLDGYLARKLNQISEVGKIIDPFADKILIALIVIHLYLIGEITPLYFFVILGRDILIFIGGIFVTKKLGYVLPSNYTGKATALLIALFLLITVLNAKELAPLIYYALYYLTIVMSFISVYVYASRAIKEIKAKGNR